MLFSGLMGLCEILGRKRASRFGHFLLSVAGPRMPKNRHVRTNLDVVLAAASDAEKAATARAIWGNFGAVVAEYPHLAEFCSAQALGLIPVCAATDMTPYIRGERAAIFVAPHLGNWEIAATIGHNLGFNISVVYSALRNPALDQKLQAMRQELRCEFIEKEGAARAMFRELRAKRCLGLVMDLRAEEGMEVDFFGRPAMAATAALALAVRLDADILPSHVERLPGSRFRLFVGEPLKPGATATGPDAIVRDLAGQLFAYFEQHIAANPGQWLCVKRRWPKPGKGPKSRAKLQAKKQSRS